MGFEDEGCIAKGLAIILFSMNLKILASSAEAESTQLILKAAQSLGLPAEVHLIETAIAAGFEADASETWIWPRLGTLSREAGLRACEDWSARGALLVNHSARAIARAGNKIESLQALQTAQLPLPRTWFFSPERRILEADLLENRTQSSARDSAPNFWIKNAIGSQGLGVSWAFDEIHAIAQCDLIRVAGGSGVIQKHAAGLDIRALVVRGEVLAAMHRSPSARDPRANLHRGGTARAIALTKAESLLAVKAAEILQLDFAGVDLIRGPGDAGSVILEVNANAGLSGLARVTDFDLPRRICEKLFFSG